MSTNTKTIIARYLINGADLHATETIHIPEGLDADTAVYIEIPKHHRYTDMYMEIFDSGDGKSPYITPHLFSPINDEGRDVE